MYQQPLKQRFDQLENCQVQKVASLLAQALSQSASAKYKELLPEDLSVFRIHDDNLPLLPV
jgi:hypothetical protein